MCIDIVIVLLNLLHQNNSRLVFQKALVAYFSDRMFPLSHRPSQTAAHVTIWKFVKPFTYVLHIAAVRPLCGVKLRLIGVSDKHIEYGALMTWRCRTNWNNLKSLVTAPIQENKVTRDIAWDRAQIWERGRRLGSLTNSRTLSSLLHCKYLKSKSSYLIIHVF
jgi:hypothetical protein